MLEALRPGMRFVDIGAHLGYEALLGSLLVGDTGRVVTFEPQPQINQWTIRNLGRFSQCRVVPSAVGSSNGGLSFSEMDILRSAFSGTGAPDSVGKEIHVSLTTLPDALDRSERPVDFIKCDVEGSELSVLQGARELLERDQPLLVLEAEMPSASGLRPRAREFAEFLAPLGYEAFLFDFDGDLKVGRIGELEVGHANVGFVPVSRAEFRNLIPR
jgi:FkbM family methyltransferase